MLNVFAKCILVATSLSPALGAVAVSQIACDEPWSVWVWWFVGALVLVSVCWGMLEYAKRKIQTHPLHIHEFERRDQEVLTFLFIYLLPFIRVADPTSIVSEWLVSVYVLAIIIVALTYAEAFHFNPVMRSLGYRFYSVRNQQGVSNLLISKEELRRPGSQVKTVLIGTNIYLHIGDCDV